MLIRSLMGRLTPNEEEVYLPGEKFVVEFAYEDEGSSYVRELTCLGFTAQGSKRVEVLARRMIPLRFIPLRE